MIVDAHLMKRLDNIPHKEPPSRPKLNQPKLLVDNLGILIKNPNLTKKVGNPNPNHLPKKRRDFR